MTMRRCWICSLRHTEHGPGAWLLGWHMNRMRRNGMPAGHYLRNLTIRIRGSAL